MIDQIENFMIRFHLLMYSELPKFLKKILNPGCFTQEL